MTNFEKRKAQLRELRKNNPERYKAIMEERRLKFAMYMHKSNMARADGSIPVYEMAVSKADFEDLVENLEQKIVENCIIILYAKLSGETHYQNNVAHWKKELMSYVACIAQQKIKESDSEALRRRCLDTVFAYGDYDKSDSATIAALPKLINEHMVNNAIIDKAGEIYATQVLPKLKDLMAKEDRPGLMEWIQEF